MIRALVRWFVMRMALVLVAMALVGLSAPPAHAKEGEPPPSIKGYWAGPISVTTTATSLQALVDTAFGSAWFAICSAKIINTSTSTDVLVGGSDVSSTNRWLLGSSATAYENIARIEGAGAGQKMYLKLAAGGPLTIYVSVVGC